MPNSTSRQFVYTIHDRPRCLGSTLWAVIDRRYRGQDVKNLVRNGFFCDFASRNAVSSAR